MIKKPCVCVFLRVLVMKFDILGLSGQGYLIRFLQLVWFWVDYGSGSRIEGVKALVFCWGCRVAAPGRRRKSAEGSDMDLSIAQHMLSRRLL